MLSRVGTRIHVIYNDKISDKKQCIKDINKQTVKDSLILSGAVAGAGISASVAANVSKNDFTKTAQKGIEKFIRRFKYKDRSIMARIKRTQLYKTFDKAPKQLKAGIMAASAAFLILLPISHAVHISNKAKIEGNYETK